MAATPQSNTTLEELASTLLAKDDFVISGHKDPDGDCIGSQLALMHALRALGKRACCVLARSADCVPDYPFLPGIGELEPAVAFDGKCGVFIAVDVPNDERLAEASALRKTAPLSVLVDHHAAPERYCDLSYTDPDSPSTTLLVWRLAKLMGAPLGGPVALCCYTGLLTDTGCFRYQSTTPESLEDAAEMLRCGVEPGSVATAVFDSKSLARVKLESLVVDHSEIDFQRGCAISWLSLDDFERVGARQADAESVINVIRAIAGVSIAILLREREGSVRGSGRAKGEIDLRPFARSFGGGGHMGAVGFSLDGPLDSAIETVKQTLFAFIDGTAPSDSYPFYANGSDGAFLR